MIYYNRLSDTTWFIHGRIELFRFIPVHSETSMIYLVFDVDAGSSLSLLEFVEVACEFAAENLSVFIYSVYWSGLSR